LKNRSYRIKSRKAERFSMKTPRHYLLATAVSTCFFGHPDPLTPLSVGNGEFAFTADITGLQTYPGAAVAQNDGSGRTGEAVLDRAVSDLAAAASDLLRGMALPLVFAPPARGPGSEKPDLLPGCLGFRPVLVPRRALDVAGGNAGVTGEKAFK